ncbi:MAG: FAD-binding protein [Saprospiraceae bacterium]|nr:FAD-binding protein [Saprospiraceae bacterium]
MGYTITPVASNYSFKNVHGNYEKPFGFDVRLYNDAPDNTIANYNNTTSSIHALLQEAKDKQVRLRACGRLWSLSEVPYVQDMCVFQYHKDNDANGKAVPSMKIKWFLQELALEDPMNKDTYLFTQTGNYIKDLNDHLKDKGRSLMTSGASNGQTIAGAIGTGVHGSSINVGSIQDTVFGLHIITGPNPQDSIYLEAEDAPIANAAFAQSINAQHIRDNKLFKAALVGLGAFGYVHGVLVKTEKAFLLQNYIKKVTIEDVYSFMSSMTVKNNGLNVTGMDPDKLFHMKFYINQYDYNDNVRAEIIYKIPDTARIGPPSYLEYNKDITLTMAKSLATVFPFLIKGIINKQLPKDGESEEGSLGEIFTDTTNLRDGQFSIAIATDVSDGRAMLEAILEAADNHKKIPSTFSLRFVKKSKATMAFTKYNMNCLFGIDGVGTGKTMELVEKLSPILDSKNIPHTWHWGKVNVMDSDFVKAAYGQSRVDWINARMQIFNDPIMAQIFTNDYIHHRGLS